MTRRNGGTLPDVNSMRPVATDQQKYFSRFLATYDVGRSSPVHRSLFASHAPRVDGIVTTDASRIVLDEPVGPESIPYTRNVPSVGRAVESAIAPHHAARS
jgi:hypothetical protein